MTVELNLWFSKKTGWIYGNIHDIWTRETHNINKMMTLEEFCQYTLQRNLMTIPELTLFVQDPDRDEEAYYAWTPGGSLAEYNPKKSIAFINFKNIFYELPYNDKEKRIYKGMPDLNFRILSRKA